MQALGVYEGTIGTHGLPLAETMSPLADPDNPEGKWRYVVDPPTRDWAEYAVELEQKKPEWSGENYLRARHFRARRVDRN